MTLVREFPLMLMILLFSSSHAGTMRPCRVRCAQASIYSFNLYHSQMYLSGHSLDLNIAHFRCCKNYSSLSFFHIMHWLANTCHVYSLLPWDASCPLWLHAPCTLYTHNTQTSESRSCISTTEQYVHPPELREWAVSLWQSVWDGSGL